MSSFKDTFIAEAEEVILKNTVSHTEIHNALDKLYAKAYNLGRVEALDTAKGPVVSRFKTGK